VLWRVLQPERDGSFSWRRKFIMALSKRQNRPRKARVYFKDRREPYLAPAVSLPRQGEKLPLRGAEADDPAVQVILGRIEVIERNTVLEIAWGGPLPRI
jgi:hypothetical protein